MKKIIKPILLLALIVVAAAIALNRQWLYDFWRGKTYVATPEMAKIRSSLNLTGEGEFLFNASQPELNSKDDFNARCRRENDEKAILGCYTEDNIYVYNITEQELDGIRELTSAHELLHAVFARMSESEKSTLKPYLDQVYKENEENLKEDLSNYIEEEKFEELYVRAGTEIKNLPLVLENHYSKYFQNQDQVVEFYDKYIVVFRELESELQQLEEEMNALAEQIELNTTDYDRRVSQLNADIISFNSCANVAGCFKSEADFYARRNALVGEQSALEQLYNEINSLIDSYNAKVEAYNADIIRSEKLNTIINSSDRPEGLE